MTRNKNSVPLFSVKYDCLKNSFSPSTIIEWNLDSNIRDSEGLEIFNKRILAFIRPSANSTFHCHCLDGLKLIAKLKLGLSHLRFHKSKHNFQDKLNLICSCVTVETTTLCLLHCPNFSKNERLTLFNKLQSIDKNILSKHDSKISKALLFGDDSFNDVTNTSVLTASIEYKLSTKRFDIPLYQNWHLSICLYGAYFSFLSKNCPYIYVI